MPSSRTKPEDSDLEAAKESQDSPSLETFSPGGKFVKHFPHEFFGARVIEEKHWAELGIKAKRVEWNETNGWKIPLSEFTEPQLNYLLNVDDGFKIVD